MEIVNFKGSVQRLSYPFFQDADEIAKRLSKDSQEESKEVSQQPFLYRQCTGISSFTSHFFFFFFPQKRSYREKGSITILPPLLPLEQISSEILPLPRFPFKIPQHFHRNRSSSPSRPSRPTMSRRQNVITTAYHHLSDACYGGETSRYFPQYK